MKTFSARIFFIFSFICLSSTNALAKAAELCGIADFKNITFTAGVTAEEVKQEYLLDGPQKVTTCEDASGNTVVVAKFNGSSKILAGHHAIIIENGYHWDLSDWGTLGCYFQTSFQPTDARLCNSSLVSFELRTDNRGRVQACYPRLADGRIGKAVASAHCGLLDN